MHEDFSEFKKIDDLIEEGRMEDYPPAMVI